MIKLLKKRTTPRVTINAEWNDLMKLFVTEIAKYLIALLLLFYTADSFGALAKPYESDRKLIYTRQIGCMFGVQITCFIQILARTGKVSYLLISDSYICFGDHAFLYYLSGRKQACHQ